MTLTYGTHTLQCPVCPAQRSIKAVTHVFVLFSRTCRCFPRSVCLQVAKYAATQMQVYWQKSFPTELKWKWLAIILQNEIVFSEFVNFQVYSFCSIWLKFPCSIFCLSVWLSLSEKVICTSFIILYGCGRSPGSSVRTVTMFRALRPRWLRSVPVRSGVPLYLPNFRPNARHSRSLVQCIWGWCSFPEIKFGTQ